MKNMGLNEIVVSYSTKKRIQKTLNRKELDGKTLPLNSKI